MKIENLSQADIKEIVPLYIAYFNKREKGEWNEKTAERRISELLIRFDFFGLKLVDEEGRLVGFIAGSFDQFTDGLAYDVNELFIADGHQNRGLGTELLNEAEKQAKAKGAFIIQLTAEADKNHDHFYNELNGFVDCDNNKLKSKLI